MQPIQCVGLIPAEREVNPAAGLNVLLMAVNRLPQAVEETVQIFGATDGAPRPLVSRRRVFAPGEHAHVYFHIPAVCFAPAFWGGKAPEELVLSGGIAAPEGRGELVFVLG